jgi:unsaturated chondroitin disaccharide hydrolase
MWRKALMGIYSRKQLFDSRIPKIIDFIKMQLENTAKQIDKGCYPRSTINENRQWKLVQSSDWTSGFYPGCLWYAYEFTKDEELVKLAEAWTLGLEKEKFNVSSHDIGFMIFCSFGNGYRLTGKERYKEVILTAAETLVKRYDENIGCIRSWDFGRWKFPVIIDSIMNLELLFWAAENGGSKELYDIAVKHADTLLRSHMREDGSLYHLVDYNPESGEVLSRESEGNKDPCVTWTRGHAWGIYGCTMAYRFTKDEKYLHSSRLMADNFLENLSEHYIPYWVIGERMHKKDSSAAAIAASGLLELTQYLKEEERQKYFDIAVNMLEALTSGMYYAEGTSSPSILLQGMGGDNEQDTALIYGDYYFIEAVIRYASLKFHNSAKSS